ncbi:MAG TPA: type II secretion system protein GspK [Kiritimatiellia bacterium]|nr:type II secretion system protein GspK [Kiritimatiellia bacterium]
MVRKRLYIFLVVVGLLSIVLGAVLALLALTRSDPSRIVVIQAGGYGALFGGVVLLLAWLLSVVSSWKRGQSPDVSRRREVESGRSGRGLRRRKKGRSGGVLVYTLGILAILSALVLHAMATFSARQKREDQLHNVGLMRAAMLEAAHDALVRLAAPRDPAAPPGELDLFRPRDWTDPRGVSIRVAIEDESQRFDLNNLSVTVTGSLRTPEHVLLDLFVQCGLFTAGDLAVSLKDWVDADNDGPREARYYLAQDRSRLPSNRILTSWDELLEIEGWSQELFERRPARTGRRDLFDAAPAEVFTLLPRERQRIIPVNLNLAARPVLLGILGMDQEIVVDRIVTFREMRPFLSLEGLDGLVSPDLLATVAPYLDVESRWYTVHVAAYREGSSAKSRWLVHREDEGGLTVVQTTVDS